MLIGGGGRQDGSNGGGAAVRTRSGGAIDDPARRQCVKKFHFKCLIRLVLLMLRSLIAGSKVLVISVPDKQPLNSLAENWSF